MASVIKLVLTGDSKSLKKAIDDGSLSLSALSAKSRESINSFAKWGAAGTVAGAAIIAGVVNSSRKSIDVLAKKSDQLGIATEKLVAFQHLGELTGVSSEKMNSSLERMSKRLGEAAQGMGAARPQLERLNLSASELVKLSPDQQYQKIADAVKGLSTQSEKAAATAAIFGREGLALLNTMEAGAEGFAQAEADVMAFGTAITRVDAAKVEAANDSFERVQEALKGVATQLTVQLAPMMKVISDRFVDAARESGGFTDQIVSGLNLAIEATAFFADTIRGLQVVWKLAEVAAMGFISLTLTGLDELQKAAAGALSWIPGVDVAPSAALSEWAEESRQALIMTNDELAKMIDEPMPGDNIKQFFATVKDEAQLAAEEIAATKQAMTGPVAVEAAAEATTDPSIQKEIDAQAAKYIKLRQMAEQFQLSEEEREIARYERENEQFNVDLEALVERGMIVDEAVATQNQARLDAEAIHQENLVNINDAANKQKLQQDRFVANAKLQVTSDLLGATSSMLMQGNKKQFEAGKKLAIAQTLVSTYQGAQQAFTSLSSIPIVGSILGAIAAAAAVVSGMSRISSIKSQKYSQAHAGLDQNPSEGTFLLKRNEMVLDAGTSEAVRQAAPALAGAGGEGGGQINLTVNINYPLSNPDWDSIAENEVKPAFDRLFNRDVFLEGVVYG
jgi:hypothetical protein